MLAVDNAIVLGFSTLLQARHVFQGCGLGFVPQRTSSGTPSGSSQTSEVIHLSALHKTVCICVHNTSASLSMHM